MENQESMGGRITFRSLKIWAPRVLAMLYVAFLALMSLDSFEGSSIFNNLVGFLVHLLPAFWIGMALLLAWHYRLIGGVAFMIMGMVFTIYYHTNTTTDRFMLISMPLFVCGMLFIFSHSE